MNRSKLFSVLAAASLLTVGSAAAQGPKPAHTVAPKAAVAVAVVDTTKKKPKPMRTHKPKKPKPMKPDTTKTKKPN